MVVNTNYGEDNQDTVKGTGSSEFVSNASNSKIVTLFLEAKRMEYPDELNPKKRVQWELTGRVTLRAGQEVKEHPFGPVTLCLGASKMFGCWTEGWERGGAYNFAPGISPEEVGRLGEIDWLLVSPDQEELFLSSDYFRHIKA